MLQDTPSLNKPRLIMAKLEILKEDVLKQISDLKLYRSGWANDIRESWKVCDPEVKDILFSLYEISGSIILALEQVAEGHYRDKMAMILVWQKLQKLVCSNNFKIYEELSSAGFTHIISTGTKQHIRIMLNCLKILIA